MAAPEVIATYTISLGEDEVWLGWSGKSGTTHGNLLATLQDADGDALKVVEVNGQPIPQDDWRVITKVTADIDGIAMVIGELHVGRGGQVNFKRTADLDDLAAGTQLTTDVSVKVSDGATLTEQTITVAIIGENDAPEVIGGYTATMSAGKNWLKWDTEEGASHENLLTTVTDVDGDALRIVRVGGIDMPEDDWRVTRDVSATINGVETLIGELHVGRSGQINFQRSADLSALSEGETLDVSADVTIADGHGGQTDQTVTIRLVGENDAPEVKAPYAISLSEDATWLRWSGAEGTTHGNLFETLRDVDGDRLTVTTVNGQAMPQDNWRVITDVTADINGIATVIGALHVGRGGQVNFQRTADLDVLAKGEVLQTSIDVIVSDAQGAKATQTINIEIVGERESTSEIIAVEAPIKESWRTGDYSYSLPDNMDAGDYEAYVAAFKQANPSVNTIRVPVNAKIFGSEYEDDFWLLTDAYAKAGYKLYFMYHDGELMDGWRDDAQEKSGAPEDSHVAFDLTGQHPQKIGSPDAPGELFSGWIDVLNALARPGNEHLIDAMYGLEFINEPAAYDSSSAEEMAWYARDAVNFYKLVARYVEAGALPNMPKILIDGSDYAQGVRMEKATLDDPQTGLKTDGLSYIREAIPSDVLVWSFHIYPGWQSTDLDVFKSWIGSAADDAILITELHLHNERFFTSERESRDLSFLFELEDFARSGLDAGVTWWTGTGSWSDHTFHYAHVAGSNDPQIVDGEKEPTGYWRQFSNFEEGETFVVTPRYGSMTALLNYDFVANHLNDETVRRGTADGLEEVAIFGSRFDDTLTGNLDANILLGGLGNDQMTLTRGQGYLLGHEGDDVMTGAGERDLLAGGEGDDTLIGKGGDDWFVGGDGNDTIDGGGGMDTVAYARSEEGRYISLWEQMADNGAGEIDTLINIENAVGSKFNDVIRGSWKPNKLVGGDGDDTLYAAHGHDVLEGGAGKDIFVLQRHSGIDTVLDFEVGEDVIEIRGGARSFAELEIRPSDVGAIISYFEDNQVILHGIAASSVTEAAFSFL